MKSFGKRIVRKITKKSRIYVSLKKQNKQLRKFYNTHPGQDCIILGAGPSLKEIPHEFLNKMTVIGTNLSFKYHTPDYWVVIDAQYSWMQEGRDLCHENNIPAFINWLWAPQIPEVSYPNEIYLHPYQITTDQSPNNQPLRRNLNKIYDNPLQLEKKGFTSVNSVVPEGAIPLALYMGFERIFLAGVDFYTPKDGTFHFMEDTKEDEERIDKLRTRLQKEDNSKKDLFDFKRWPIELVGESKNKHRVFNLSEKSTVKNIPKINYKDVKFPE
jgi:hypothetical protein